MAALTGAQVRNLRVLHAVWSICGGEARESVRRDDLREALEVDPALVGIDLNSELALLKQRGLVDTWVGGQGVETAFLLPEGRNLAEDFDRRRTSLPERRRQLRHDYLYWLYDEIEGKDRGPTPDDFLATTPRYLGEPYTSADLEKAGEWLKERAFISGQGAWQYSGPLRPKLTAKGTWTVESGQSPNDPPAATQQFTTIVNGDANVANGSNHVVQQLAKDGGWITDAKSLLDSIEQALPALGASADAAQLVAQARSAVDAAEPKPRKVRKALGAVGDFLGRAGSGALGGILAKQVADLLASIP